MAKPRQKGMRKGHMKRFSSTMMNGGTNVNPMALKRLYYDKNINPDTPEPSRKQLRKNDPSYPIPKITDFMTTNGKIDKYKFEEAIEDWHKRRDNPTMTTPMVEKLLKHNEGHFGLKPKEEDNWFVITLMKIPDEWKFFYKGYTELSTCYFTRKSSHGITRTSITYPRYKALLLRENGLKGIIWK